MTYKNEYKLLEQIIQLLSENGENKFSQVIEKVVNEAMKIERNIAVNAAPYERSSERRGYANGFKEKTGFYLAVHEELLRVQQSIP